MKKYTTPSLSKFDELVSETITANSGSQNTGSVCNRCGCCRTYSEFITKHCNWCPHGPIDQCQLVKYYTFPQ